ncbi:hypothetical protein ASF58_23275 [Methylobacterium sp. Leaf125]|uniref:hypothetical protein n=1 Tax=Methylobacterium sp. Leaf125 TaxID=1736265 RepID=UPI000702348F|nr:hypothetical protein [Methylobacterium sp. Leaf125]KQQ39065.1 hypothetical protein ASF58_23275 [Methylobacterium sp. Leaf125]
MNAPANTSSVSTILPSISISASRKRKSQPTRQRDTRGDRYTLGRAYKPAGGVATVPRKAAALPDLVAVPDPYGEPGDRIIATVNRRVDLLEAERAKGNITVSQYETGRQVQAIFEKAAGARNTHEADFGDVRISDPARRPETLDLDAIRAITNAKEVAALMRRVQMAIGETPAHFLRELLTRGGTIKDYVHSCDPLAGERQVTRIGDRFRYLLEVLDDAFAARGMVVKDEAGECRIRADRGETIGEETDERGRLVQAGRGYRWGRVAASRDAEA